MPPKRHITNYRPAAIFRWALDLTRFRAIQSCRSVVVIIALQPASGGEEKEGYGHWSVAVAVFGPPPHCCASLEGIRVDDDCGLTECMHFKLDTFIY